MSHTLHKKEAPQSISCKIITVSDTRTKETDKSGQTMIDLLEAAGHRIVKYEIVTDETHQIREAIERGLKMDAVEAILINGGTGIAKRDVTIETVQELFEKEIAGFGEIFRMLSYQEDIGSSAILSRAAAGVAQGKVIFSTPGSTGAVRLAMNKLILPELGHIIRELNK
ncbi:MogA/MoaB family molybdenum cofactor biosynthesis protein [Peribacillus deserti]|uniref:Molybdenum cofactor biosynthesis protein B n=1 Tax=Peribacillus deserti TaxID=673318 RepID=A0A2N5M0J9_9BACI|nr:molybdenum cofactor biosynthesis protein B [Peribacillus deserti]PLT27835.1 molybdenum cofactor biosynthesis protein [Peribacillus deserti]